MCAGIMDVSSVFRIAFLFLNIVELNDFGKTDDGVERGAQLVGHVRKEYAFCTIGHPCFQHRFIRDRGSPFRLLLRLEQHEPGIPAFKQDAELTTVVLEQASVFSALSIAHRRSSVAECQVEPPSLKIR